MVPVFFVDNEVEAELARGLLESEGVKAYVRFTARSGEPAYAAGYGGLGAPLQTYEVLVAETDADVARDILRMSPRERPARAVWRRALVVILLTAFLGPLLYAAWQQARLFF